MPSMSDQLEQLILKSLSLEVERSINTAVQMAQKEVETKIREQTAAIVCAVQRRMTFERFGQELVIRVNFDNTQKTA